VARDSVLQFAPEAKIVAHHGDVMTPEFGPAYVEKFDLVLNALDNLPARRHMNKMCLAAGVPLIDSGTQGWLGQVQPFASPETSCFDCEEHPTPTTYPVCTIRSKPSKPIHCIHWAKLMFARLFGKPDREGCVLDLNKEDEEAISSGTTQNSVAPNDDSKTVDAELQKILDAENTLLDKLRTKETFAEYVFHKLFHTDTLQLASMKHMWEDRAPPIPLVFQTMVDGHIPTALGSEDTEVTENLLPDQRVWSVQECVQNFRNTVFALNSLKNDKGGLDWDKDEDLHLDFVVAASNLRCSQFGIPRQSRWTVKSAAGNIIPAIATTNAIISGLMVTEALKILRGGDFHKDLRYTYLQKTPSNKRMLLLVHPEPQKENCFVCGSNFVHVALDTDKMTVGEFASSILEKHLQINFPSIMIDSNIVFEGGDMLEDFEHQIPKTLAQVGIRDGTIVRVSDMTSSAFSVDVSIVHKAKAVGSEASFELKGSVRRPPSTDTRINTTENRDDGSDDDFLIIVDPKNSGAAEVNLTSETDQQQFRKRKRDNESTNPPSATTHSAEASEPTAKRVKVIEIDENVMQIDD
jgi:ubiquitin-like 1-activating enzyme E1 B